MTSQHIYKSILPVKSKRELAELMFQNILYNKDGVVAINKPYGLRNGVGFDDPFDRKFNSVCKFDFDLRDILPSLASMLDLPQLMVSRSPERYASGVTLLNANNDAGIQISRSVSCSSFQARFTYHALCYGVPLKVSDEAKLALKSETIHKDTNIVVLTDKFTKSAVRKSRVKSIFYYHNVLATDPDQKVSLVEVISSRILWYYVPLYLATRLMTPVLGDQIFGSKVKQVFGKPVLLPRLNPTAHNPQKLPKEFYESLLVPEVNFMIIPNHLHLAKITLHNFNEKGKHFEISAPSPPYFQWTCSQLKLWNNPETSVPLEISI